MPPPNSKDTLVELQNQDLLAQTYHIDGRVTAIEGRLTSFGDQLNRIEQSMLNRAPIVSTSNILTIMTMVAALLYGISGYVNLQLDNQAEDIHRNTSLSDRQQDQIEALKQFQREMHYEVGSLNQKHEASVAWRNRHEDRSETVDARLQEVEQRAAAAEVSRRAIGDFVKDVDTHGSRRWIEKERQP